jgi:prepilin-type N-terminal cleavage/methylation domain-containing protein
MRSSALRRSAFTLVELVVVLLILGILASIAAPRAFETSRTATENGARQSLSVIRSAIETYSAEHNGALPGADRQSSTLINDLDKYLRGDEFPICPVGAAKNNEIHILSDGELPEHAGAELTHSWGYSCETGEFYINSAETSFDGTTPYFRF